MEETHLRAGVVRDARVVEAAFAKTAPDLSVAPKELAAREVPAGIKRSTSLVGYPLHHRPRRKFVVVEATYPIRTGMLRGEFHEARLGERSARAKVEHVCVSGAQQFCGAILSSGVHEVERFKTPPSILFEERADMSRGVAGGNDNTEGVRSTLRFHSGAPLPQKRIVREHCAVPMPRVGEWLRPTIPRERTRANWSRASNVSFARFRRPRPRNKSETTTRVGCGAAAPRLAFTPALSR